MKTSGTTSNIARIIADAIKSQKYVLRIYVFSLNGLSNGFLLSIDKQIIASAILIKLLPDPLRQIIGDFAQNNCVLLGMYPRRMADHLDSTAVLAQPIEEQC